VEGIEVCPDCKVPLVDSLSEGSSGSEEEVDEALIDEENEETEDENLEDIEQVLLSYSDEAPNEEMIEELKERARLIAETKSYKPKSDTMSENRSAAFALLSVGIAGALVLVLNALKIIRLPLDGFSMTTVYLIMGGLFLVFIITGIRSAIKVKKLAGAVKDEAELKDKILDFIEINKDKYRVSSELEKEEAFLEKCSLAVKDIESEFEDLEPGFAYYVVDRFAGDLLYEN